MMKTLFKPAQLATAVAVAISAPAVLAHNHETVVTLDPIVITATRAAEKASAVPATISVIDRKTIEQNPALNLADVLKKETALTAKQYGSLGQSVEMSLRGTAPKHTLYLKDGVRLNTENDFTPITAVDLDLTDIEQVEILKGPASVQYGTDAIGGAVQLVSKTPTQNSAFVTGVYGSNDTYKAIVGADLVAENGLYAQVRGQRLESDGFRIFNTQSKGQKAPFEQRGYNAKVGYDQKGAVKAHIEVSENNGTSNYSDNSGKTNAAEREFENRIISGQVSLKSPVHDAMPEVTLRVSNIKNDQKHIEQWASFFNTETNEVDVNARWHLTNKQNVLVGTTQRDSDYESSSITNNAQTSKTRGYYAQHQYNSEKLNTQLGVRIEDNKQFGTHTVGQGAIRYNFTPTTSVYANVGSAFRSPTLNELYTTWGGNPNLKPEESLSYELGLNQKIGENVTVNLTGYRTEIKNLIVSSNSTNWVYQNIDKATFKGGEVGIKVNKGDLFANAQYAFVETENKANGLEIAYRPKHKGTFTVGLANDYYGFSTSVVGYSKANTANVVNSPKVDSHTVVDVDSYINITPYAKVFANVQNVGNSTTHTVDNFGNWYINTGRQANLGLTLKY